MKIMHTVIFSLLGLAGILGINSCVGIPKGAVAVTSFEVDKYLGKWYEIARMDLSFERDLMNTTAYYSLNADGSIKVENRGFNFKTNKWSQAVGKAKFVGDTQTARLKVSFFGPFYGGYNVIALDKEYKYALVAGNNVSYMWILSRETTIPENIKQNFLKIAQDIEFKTSSLIWVKHDTQ